MYFMIGLGVLMISGGYYLDNDMGKVIGSIYFASGVMAFEIIKEISNERNR